MGFLDSLSFKEKVASIRLDFSQDNKVLVKDDIPNTIGDNPGPLWFAIMYVSKLVFNMPEVQARILFSTVSEVLSLCTKLEEPLASNYKLIGICAQPAPTIVSNLETNRYLTYTGTMYTRKADCIMQTRIAYGNEEYLHRAAIDTVFENARLRMGDNGGLACAAALFLYAWFAQKGTRNMQLNMHAASITMGMVHAMLLSKDNHTA